MDDSDTIFLKRFSMVIAVLVAITVVIIVIAVNTTGGVDPNANPSRLTLADKRTLPVGAVRTELSAADLAAVDQACRAHGFFLLSGHGLEKIGTLRNPILVLMT